MRFSVRKWIITAVEIIGVVVGVWRGPAIFNYLTERRATASEIERRSQPTTVVRGLLNRSDIPAPRLDGKFTCVFAIVEDSKPHAQFGKCATPTEHTGPVDRFEADLRYGNFVLRQSDLYVNDVFDVPITRTYNSGDYLNQNPVHAFGTHTSPF